MTRIIPISVKDEYIVGGGVVVGAKGSHNDVVLEITFSPLWEGLAKSIVWWDARQETATKTILTADLYRDGKYYVPIPAGVKTYDGDISLNIRGAESTETEELRATATAGCTFRVLDNEYTDDAQNEEVPEPSTVEQLQTQIDKILSDIDKAATGADRAEAAAEGAEADKTAAENAKDAAVTAAGNAATSATAAQNAAASAGNSATAAAGSAEGAQNSATAASTSAETATEAATTAKSAKTAAETANESAQSAKNTAAAAATTATGAATSAQGAATSAGNSASSAAKDAKTAQSWAVGGTGSREGEDTNNAKYWSDVAQGAAGGGVTAFNGRSGAVTPQSGDYTADMVGARPDTWTPTASQVGADPAGSAASALTAAKSYADSLAKNYDAAGSAASALAGAKSYADGLGKNYDPAGAAAGVQTALAPKIEAKADKVKDSFVTLLATGWSAEKEQVLTVGGLDPENGIEVGLPETATDEEYTAASEAQLRPIAKATGSVTIKAMGDAPTINIPVLVRELD